MANLNIHATLGLTPTIKPQPAPEVLVLTRGASAELLFDFCAYSYLIDSKNPFKYIDQITFLFKQNEEITYFEMLDQYGRMNPEFAYDPDRLCISLLLSPSTTAAFELSSETNPMYFEIAIRANTETITEQKKDTVIIEPQKPIVVVDSLYNQAKLATNFK